MYDCKIPDTADSRDAEIKKYIEKLGSIERGFADSMKEKDELQDVSES